MLTEQIFSHNQCNLLLFNKANWIEINPLYSHGLIHGTFKICRNVKSHETFIYQKKIYYKDELQKFNQLL